jgi:hypothetical protein
VRRHFPLDTVLLDPPHLKHADSIGYLRELVCRVIGQEYATASLSNITECPAQPFKPSVIESRERLVQEEQARIRD